MRVSNWTWFGQAGHFCAADRCCYHLHTHVGNYCVSTVGEYFLSPNDRRPVPVGSTAHLYECLVFRLDESGEHIAEYVELEVVRSMTREEAQAAHAKMCRKWSKK